MTTTVTAPTESALIEAGELIRAGENVAFPTETVYGLAANAYDEKAVHKIFVAKGRPGDNPLIVHISAIEQIYDIINGEMPKNAKLLADAYWPGPLTMIFEKSSRIPDAVTAGLSTVAVRMPAHDVARAFIDACGVPIAAPSANLSGKPSPTTAEHVFNDLNGRVPLIIDGGACDVGLESTVLDARTDIPMVLRPGGVTPEMIESVIGNVSVDPSVMKLLAKNATVRSPGMKYKHYAPNGALTIVKGDAECVAKTICDMYDSAEGESCILALDKHIALYGNRRVHSLGEDASEVANRLFDCLREMDNIGVKNIYAEAVSTDGIGLAVMNRLGRAAAFRIIEAGKG